MSATPFDTLRPLPSSDGRLSYHSLPALEEAGVGRISRLPVSIRIVLEAVLRHCDGDKVTAEHVRELASWQPEAERSAEIPFVVARIVLQDFTGVPLLVDSTFTTPWLMKPSTTSLAMSSKLSKS
mgnify:CR=1 FL=1